MFTPYLQERLSLSQRLRVDQTLRRFRPDWRERRRLLVLADRTIQALNTNPSPRFKYSWRDDPEGMVLAVAFGLVIDPEAAIRYLCEHMRMDPGPVTARMALPGRSGEAIAGRA